MSNQHRQLSDWHLGDSGLQPRPDRRALIRTAFGASAAMVGLSAWGTAHALSLENLPATLIGAISPRKGVVPWDDLAAVEAPIGQKPQFSAAVTKLNGRPVVIEGHMMVLDDDNPINRFLLTAYQAHCPYCMPGGFTSIVAIHADHSVRVTDRPLTMRGTLRLLADGKSQLFYQLDKAVLV